MNITALLDCTVYKSVMAGFVCDVVQTQIMQRSSTKRLMSRNSEIFASSPDCLEFAEAGTDVTAVVASQLGKPTQRTDEKWLCNVLFSDKKQKQTNGSTNQALVSKKPNAVVSCYFLMLISSHKTLPLV